MVDTTRRRADRTQASIAAASRLPVFAGLFLGLMMLGYALCAADHAHAAPADLHPAAGHRDVHLDNGTMHGPVDPTAPLDGACHTAQPVAKRSDSGGPTLVLPVAPGRVGLAILPPRPLLGADQAPALDAATRRALIQVFLI